MNRLERWLDGAEEHPRRDLFALPAASDRHQLARFIADQLREEQNLSAVRMNWNLTFQGFCVAGYAVLAAAENTSPARYVIQFAVAAFAGTVAFMTLKAILASQRQREYLKRAWEHAALSESFPEPFSSTGGSREGRRAAHVICLATLCMWLVLGIAAVVHNDFEGRPAQDGVRLVRLWPAAPGLRVRAG